MRGYIFFCLARPAALGVVGLEAKLSEYFDHIITFSLGGLGNKGTSNSSSIGVSMQVSSGAVSNTWCGPEMPWNWSEQSPENNIFHSLILLNQNLFNFLLPEAVL